ncbi:MAG TPA: FtsQ-type POTRA domain-containing protein [Verrucomicrobiae bacterium]
MWFRRENKNRNRRLGRGHVLDVKLRSDQVRATRLRLAAIAFAVIFGTFFGLYLVWRTGEVILDAFVYENADFAITNVDVQTDGVILPEQLRRWSNVRPGANLFAIDLAAVKRNLEMVSAVDTVSVERVLPHTLKIRVTERDPIAQVNVPRADGADGIALAVYQLDASGVVMQPLDPRQCIVPLSQLNPQLPVLSGFNVLKLSAGHPIDAVELPHVQAALQLISAFDHSPMAGLVDLRRVDVSAPGVIIVTTGQGSQITFALENLDRQLRRWREIYDYAAAKNSTVASADLAVGNNVPVHLVMAGILPAAAPKTKPSTNRKKNV